MARSIHKPIPLTRRQRKVCTLAWGEGKTNREIADQLSMCRDNVKQMIYRAERRLKEAGISIPRRLKPRRVRVRSLSDIGV